MDTRRRRVFLGTVEIAGYYSSLAEGLRRAGLECLFVELIPHPFEYGNTLEQRPPVVRMARALAATRIRFAQATGLRRQLARFVYLLESLSRMIVLAWAIPRFDIFCFGFKSNIVGTRIGYWDVAFLKLLGKRVIYVFHGADGRPPYLTGPFVRMTRRHGKDWPKVLRKLTHAHKQTMVALERIADVLVNNPAQGHFHESSFVNIMHVGIPVRVDNTVPSQAKERRLAAASTRILHAPSNREAKGSDAIAACIENLRAKGYQIEYIELTGLPNDRVAAELKACDFVVDQIYADGPMAGFAAEAAAHGKPAVVGGYLEDRTWVDRIPTLYCHPDDLEAGIQRLLDEPGYRDELGRRAREFVTVQWSATAVARRFLKLIVDDIPDDWWFDPKHVTHLQGGGMNEDLLREALARLVSEYGPGALELEDKPALRDMFLTLAKSHARLASTG